MPIDPKINYLKLLVRDLDAAERFYSTRADAVADRYFQLAFCVLRNKP